MKTYYIYILKCSDGTYYTGVTNDVQRRLSEHREGTDERSYTYRRRPVELVWYTTTNNVSYAIEREKQIKKWSHSKKEALINGDFNLLKKISKKKF